MPAPIALQLYTVRDQLARDFAGVIQRIAGMGYIGVETAGFPGTTPGEAARLFKEIRLTVSSAHTSLPLGDQKNAVLDLMGTLDCNRIVSGLGAEQFQTRDQVRRACDLFNEAGAVARIGGLTFGIHNHWWEFQEVEPGRSAFQVMLEYLDPAVFFELDTYWIQTAGGDPAAVIRELGRRAPLLHLKDGPCVVGQPMVAVGDGRLDVPGIVKAGEATAEWMIVELDACATDMLAAVQKSYEYLVRNGLADGHKN